MNKQGRIMEGRRYSDGLHQAIEAKENVKIESATQTFATITLQNYFQNVSQTSRNDWYCNNWNQVSFGKFMSLMLLKFQPTDKLLGMTKMI